jgi:hypothetical protein
MAMAATMAVALVASLVLAGEAGASGGGTADCPQPADADSTYRLRFGDYGALLRSCTAVLDDGLAVAVGNATDTIVFASGWRGDPDGRSPVDERFVRELRQVGPAAAAGFRPVFIELGWRSAFFPFHTGSASVAGTRALPSSFDDFADAMRRLFPWLRETGVLDLREVFDLLAAETRGQRATLRDFTLLARILKRWDGAGAPGPEAGCEGQHGEAPGEASIFELEATRLGQYLWDTAYLWQGARQGRVAPSVLGPLHIFTFWQMRRRAGVLGGIGGAGLLRTLRAAAGPAAGTRAALHLVGHSFGAKLLAAALANCARSQPAPVRSLVLLQGTLSHLAFFGGDDVRQVWKAERPGGLYAPLIERHLVDGPIVVTHSSRDVPNAFWYPLGLRAVPGVLEQQSIRPTMYGSLGASGAQRVEAAHVELAAGGRSGLRERAIVNVRVDGLVGGHDQILAREIYDLVWAAVRWRTRP